MLLCRCIEQLCKDLNTVVASDPAGKPAREVVAIFNRHLSDAKFLAPHILLLKSIPSANVGITWVDILGRTVELKVGIHDWL